MKLKLLIALVAVPSWVMAQPNVLHQLPTLTTTGQPGATPTQQTAPNPNSTTGSSSGNKQTNVGGIYMDFDSSGKSTSTTPANVGGKADKYGTTGPDREQTATNSNKATGSSDKATVKGSNASYGVKGDDGPNSGTGGNNPDNPRQPSSGSSGGNICNSPRGPYPC